MLFRSITCSRGPPCVPGNTAELMRFAMMGLLVKIIDLDKASKHYKISFIYNELEDFTVTQNVKTANIPDAIRKVIGFYPMQMTVGYSLITVECIRKSERKLIGRLIDNHNLPVEFANISCLTRRIPPFSVEA